jgi:AcrR family transcriptional regulator
MSTTKLLAGASMLEGMSDQREPVTPNRRGVKSRELVLDAAERVMAREGFEAATINRIVDEAGVPLSSVYHFYGSKDGVLLAVMQRGAERFFADVPDYDKRSGTAVEHLRLVLFDAVDALERQPNFLRLIIAFSVQPPQGGDGEISDVVRHVRELALKRLRRQIAIACDDSARSRVVDRVARLALAAVDGAFVATSADPSITLAQILELLPDALVAARQAHLPRGRS